MKKFNPEMKVVRFRDEDVIVTSGVTRSLLNGDILKLQGFGDSDAYNNLVFLNDGSGIPLLSNEDSINSVLSALGATGNEEVNRIDTAHPSLRIIFERADREVTLDYNGTYKYNSSSSAFKKIQ